MDDVDNPGNCCKFVKYVSFFKILNNVNNTFLVECDGYKVENHPEQCLCTGTNIDDPNTPGSCCMDDVDNPGNCCKFVKYPFAKFSLI